MSGKKGGDYDYGRSDAPKLKPYDVNFTKKKETPLRVTGNYGDNAMVIQQNEDAASDSTLDRLMDILVKAGMNVDAIKAGATLTDRGFQKVAARLDVSAEQAMMLLKSLRKKLTTGDDLSRMVVSENDGNPRFSYENDGLLNVTVRDRETGEETYVSGSKGKGLVDALAGMVHGSPEQQALLSTYMDVENRRGISEDESVEDDFLSEISSDVTTFNFPWKHGNEIGTATAQCKGDGDDFEITVIDARDSEGEDIKITDALEVALKDQAVEFIPEA